jgi:hypothetical protein
VASWFRPLDLLPGGLETAISAESSLEASIQRIIEDSRLLTDPVVAHADFSARNSLKRTAVRGRSRPRPTTKSDSRTC